MKHPGMKSLSEDPVSGYDPDAVTRSITVDIVAPADVVWAVLTDLPRYNEWNPFCVRAESTLKMGDPMFMTLVNYAVPGHVGAQHGIYLRLRSAPAAVVGNGLHRRLALPCAPRPGHRSDRAGDRCRYHSTDAFLGANGIHVFRFAGPWVKRAFDDSALALKARAEALHAGG